MNVLIVTIVISAIGCRRLCHSTMGLALDLNLLLFNNAVVMESLRGLKFIVVILPNEIMISYSIICLLLLRQVITFNTHADQSTSRPVNGTLVAIPTATT